MLPSENRPRHDGTAHPVTLGEHPHRALALTGYLLRGKLVENFFQIVAVVMQKLISMNADRVFYRGLLGQPGERVLGALTLYASVTGELQVRIGDGPEQRAECVVVAPYTPHRVASADGWVHCLLIEPEYVDRLQLLALPASLQARRIRDAGIWLQSHAHVHAPLTSAEFDTRVFGADLPRRRPDPRIAGVIERMRQAPADAFAAQDCARTCGLSTSRFLHLFKTEAGASFRNLRAWKRARSLLERVSQVDKLTDLALDMGYPDATHFCHAIRHFYGLRPKDIVAGSRRLERVGEPVAH